MATLTNGSSWTGEVTLSKKTGTLLNIPIASKYADRSIQFTLDVQSGATAANTAVASADVESNSGTAGVNISNAIGAKSASEPTGYYIRIKATGKGSSKVTTAGWLDTGSLNEATAQTTYYFPIASATATLSGSNTVTPTAGITGSNVTLSNTDNGISVTATGGGTAVANAVATTSRAGYVPNNTGIASGTLESQPASTQTNVFLSGVTLTKPSSGTRSFSVTVPNGSTTQTITFTVDASGNVLVS